MGSLNPRTRRILEEAKIPFFHKNKIWTEREIDRLKAAYRKRRPVEPRECANCGKIFPPKLRRNGVYKDGIPRFSYSPAENCSEKCENEINSWEKTMWHRRMSREHPVEYRRIQENIEFAKMAQLRWKKKHELDAIHGSAAQ